MDEAAEQAVSRDLLKLQHRDWLKEWRDVRVGRVQVERSMWSRAVVVPDVNAEDVLQLAISIRSRHSRRTLPTQRLPAKDRQLVSEDEDLQLLRPLTTAEKHDQLKQAAEDEVDDRRNQKRPPAGRDR